MDKQGRRRDYSSAYLRRTYRAEGKVKNETVANLSSLPDHVIDVIDAALKGQQVVPVGEAVTIAGSLPHGHVAAVHAMAARLGLAGLLGPACPARDLVLALVISRVVRPGSKLATLTWWMTPRWGLTWVWPGRPPMTSTRRWTGWQAAAPRTPRPRRPASVTPQAAPTAASAA